jgi:DNA polymerase-4
VSDRHLQLRSAGLWCALGDVIAACVEAVPGPDHRQAAHGCLQRGVEEIHTIFRDYTDLIEPLSLDEAYLDVSDSPHFGGSATRIAQDIRRRVSNQLHITVSAGVAPNKFLAKIASDWKKPNGLFVITPDQVEDFVSGLPVSKLHGWARSLRTSWAPGHCRLLQLREWESWRWCANSAVLVSDCGVWPVGLMTAWCITTVAASRSVSKIPTMSICRISEVAWISCRNCWKPWPGAWRDRQQLSPGKPFVKVKFHDFTQTTLEQAGAGRDLGSYQQMLTQAFNRGGKPVRLLGVGCGWRICAAG